MTAIGKQWVFAAARVNLVRRGVMAMHLGAQRLTRPRHSFDRALGIRADGFVSSFLLLSSRRNTAEYMGYLGCVPGTLGRILSFIPDPEIWSFVDLGCGMGRALAVASAIPFRSVIGIEINADLVRIARRNAASIAKRHPKRTSIEVQHGDATFPRLRGPTILFMYHSFGPSLLNRLLDHVEASIRLQDDVLLIYVNPINGHHVDRRPAFRRWKAEIIPHDAADRAYTSDADDAVVIWHLGPAPLDPADGCDRRIIPVTSSKASLATCEKDT